MRLRKIALISAVLLLCLSPYAADPDFSTTRLSDFDGNAEPLVPQEKTEKSDYLNRLLSRNTNPLGLKENPALKKLMNQPGVKWAVRAEFRQILH